MTVQDIIDDARPKLRDTVKPYIFLDPHFYAPINTAVRELARTDPDSLYYNGAVVTNLPSAVTAVSDTVEIADLYRNELVELTIKHLKAETKRDRPPVQVPQPTIVTPGENTP